MKNRFALLLLSLGLLSISSLSAQRHSFMTNGPIQDHLPFIAAETFGFYIVPMQQTGFPEGVRLRWKDGAGNTSEWHEFHRDGHADADRFVSQLGFAQKRRWTDFELEMPSSGPVTLFFYDPGETETETENRGELLEGALCFKPLVQERNDWCPAGNCPVDATPAATTTTHMIVHHSAGANQSADWSAIVRIIWDFHVNGNGWDDIGYNYLVDPNGVIYVGRGNEVRGAHFCGNNTSTMGTCLLGTFTSQLPTTAALESLAELLAWKAQQNDIDPLAISFHAPSNDNLNNLAAHRQGCSTECPGQAFFDDFANFRQQVSDVLANCLTSSTTEPEPAWASSINISPNPSRDIISISGLPTQGTIQLYSITGELLLSTEVSKVTNVEARLMVAAPGAYILRVEQEGKAISRNIIRQ